MNALHEVVGKFYDGHQEWAALSFAENEKITLEELESVLDYIFVLIFTFHVNFYISIGQESIKYGIVRMLCGTFCLK